MKRHCFAVLFVLSACAASPDQQTVRVCKDGSCQDVPRSASTFVPESVSTPAQDQKLESLRVLAERDPRAAFDLGLRLYRGDGVARDPHQALSWMRSAGERGNLDAQLALGGFYLAGLAEMGPDPAEAEIWLNLAAVRGSAEAKRLLPQAAAAKRAEREGYRVREHNKNQWHGLWGGGYAYKSYWRDSGWLFY